MPHTTDTGSYGYISDIALFEGQLASDAVKLVRYYRNDSDAVIPFGRAVVKGANDRDAKLPTTGGGVFLGVALSAQIYEEAYASNGDSGYPADRAMDVLEKGDIAVYVEEAISVGDAVYFRHTANGTGKNVIGRFRNDADAISAVPSCDQITGAKWLKGTTGAGIAVLRLG